MTTIQGYDPRTGEPWGSAVTVTADLDVDRVATAAAAAAQHWATEPLESRIRLLTAIANRLDAALKELVDVADAETALGRTRLTGEVARTTGQLRLFADVVRDGGFLNLIISPASASEPDVRRHLRPVGPVAVFSASNFPFAFSVAGGDTASALAAGCPVIVKAHEAHPHTSELTAQVVRAAVAEAGAPAGVFGLVHGVEAGLALVRHRLVRAVGFTGSLQGGRRLFDVAAGRPDPIPFFGELGSVNPAVIMPAAAASRGTALAESYAASLTLGAGQFCTNPGLLFVPSGSGQEAAVSDAVAATHAAPMLTRRIFTGYEEQVAELDSSPVLASLARGTTQDAVGPWAAVPCVFRIDLEAYSAHLDELVDETFGPAGLVVTYADVDDLAAVLRRLPGQLSASVHADPGDREAVAVVQDALVGRVGRLAYNQWTTGVSVCWAMTHGGPWPATTAAAHTSVGATAINRWLAPVSFQNWPDELLPEALQESNPLGLPRRTASPR